MKAKFKLAIANKERHVSKFLLLLSFVLVPIVLFSLLLDSKMISAEQIPFEILLPLYLVLVIVFTLLVAKSTTKLVELSVTETSLESNGFESISYKEIIDYNTIIDRKLISLFTRIDFYSYKIMCSPSNIPLISNYSNN
jgi:hypothetical protein